MKQTEGEAAFRAAIAHAEASGVRITGFTPGTAEDIAAMEQRLGFPLPPSYRLMVELFGNVCFGSMEIYGLTKPNFNARSVPNVIFTTETARQRNEIGDGMLYFMSAGYGPIFCLDCHEVDAAGEAPVYEIATAGVDFGKDLLAPSFGQFILDEVRHL